MIELDDRSIERVADRVVAVLEARLGDVVGKGPAETGLVDAQAVAALLGVSRTRVYSHAEELGVIRLGEGERPRLRFDPERVKAGAEQIKRMNATQATTRRSTRSRRASAPLLPIRGERAP